MPPPPQRAKPSLKAKLWPTNLRVIASLPSPQNLPRQCYGRKKFLIVAGHSIRPGRITITMWKFFRIVAYMQNNFRITRLKHLGICAKLSTKPSTVSKSIIPYPPEDAIPRASLIALQKRGQRKRSGSHQNTFTLIHDEEEEMSKRPKKLLDQACTELVEVSATRSAASTTPCARKKPTSAGSNATFSTTANDIPRTWALRKRCPELVEGSRPS